MKHQQMGRYNKVSEEIARFIVLFCLVFLCAIRSSAQKDSTSKSIRKNIVYGEILGNTLIFSINYERIFIQNNNIWLSTRIGYSSVKEGAIGEGQEAFRTIPIECIVMSGEKNHFELSLGATSFWGKEESSADNQVEYQLIPACRIGYRYQASGGRFMLRTGVCLMMGGAILPGLAMGYAF